MGDCNELADRAGSCLPFQGLDLPLLWWEHFGERDGLDFAQLRGRNFMGIQSWVEHFQLLVAENGGTLCGLVPLVSSIVRTSTNSKRIRVLSFAADPVLVAYQDMLAEHENRSAIVNALFDEILRVTTDGHDLLFLGYIPSNSPNLPILRDLLLAKMQDGWIGGEALNRRRGGVRPWTLHSVIHHCRRLRETLTRGNHRDEELADLIDRLEGIKPNTLLFERTRLGIEGKLRSLVARIANEIPDNAEIKEVEKLLSPSVISYPYLILPDDREEYLSCLSKETRRYFRRYGKRFREQGGSFERIPPGSLKSADIEDYLDLHSLRWRSDSLAVNHASVEFHRELGSMMAAKGCFSLFFANYRGKRIAAHSCLDIGRRREGYFTGRDPDMEELRSGRLLYMETILDAIDQGFTHYDLGYGGDDYKLSFANATNSVSHILLAPHSKMPPLAKVFPRYEYVAFD